MYDVFIRRWYRANPKYPGGLEPHLGRKTFLAHNVTREEALRLCEQYNSTHNPGKFQLKAEFQSR